MSLPGGGPIATSGESSNTTSPMAKGSIAVRYLPVTGDVATLIDGGNTNGEVAKARLAVILNLS